MMLLSSFSALLAISRVIPALAQEAQYAVAYEPGEKEAIDFCINNHNMKPDTFVVKKNADGAWDCIICAGPMYTDPKTHAKKCCPWNQSFSTDPIYTTEGACCGAGLSYSFDPRVGKGACCATGKSFVDGDCRYPTPNPPNPVPNPSTKPGCNCHDNNLHAQSCSDKLCPQDFVCACDGHLGIRYGHCYTMTDVNGLQLNRDTGGTYQSGGDIGNLIFRVCRTTDDCTDSKGTLVPEKGSWYLEDQLGARGTPGPSWFGAQDPHMGIVAKTQPQRAAHFTAEPFCFFGSCSLCLRLASGDRTGLSAPCPLGGNADMAHVGRAGNPNNCKAYRFQEIKCLDKVNPST